MPETPSVLHRARKNRETDLPGTVLAVTTVMHPPHRFGKQPRVVALIEREDGTKVMGACTSPCAIGDTVTPRMRLSSVNEEGLRRYDTWYEPLTKKSEELNIFKGYILALTGPSGVGKSTISHLLTQAFEPYVAKVPIITTRKRKAGDDGEYRYVSRAHFEQLQKTGSLAALTDIPSKDEERLYAYRKSDLEAIWAAGKIPVVVTEMHLLQGLAQSYGRRSLLSFGLLPPGKSKRARLSQLLRRLRTRGRETERELKDRLKNAERDLQFFSERSDLFDDLLVNESVDGVIEMLKERVPALKKA